MADLPEFAEWVTGVYQIEQTDPVLGGPPNESTGAGISNLPALHLAKRTLWLRQVIQNAGIGVPEVIPVTSFDALTDGGLYGGPSSTIGAPDATAFAVVLHIPTDNANAAIQIAARIGTINRMWMRRKQAGAWQPWVEIMTGSSLQATPVDATAGKILTVGSFGLGADSGQRVTNLDAVSNSGFYGTDGTVTGAPVSGVSFSLMHMQGRNGSASQFLVANSTNRTWSRYRYEGGAWQAWQEVWLGATANASAAANGYQQLPSGLILQWGNGNTDAAGSVSITFPIAFPTSCRSLTFGDQNANGVGSNAHLIGARAVSQTGFVAHSYLHDGTQATTGFYYMAIGY